MTRASITKEDPPNALQVQHRPKPRFDETLSASVSASLTSASMSGPDGYHCYYFYNYDYYDRDYYDDNYCYCHTTTPAATTNTNVRALALHVPHRYSQILHQCLRYHLYPTTVSDTITSLSRL